MRDRLGVSPTLAPAVWCSQRGTLDNCRGLCGMAWKWAATMGRLEGPDERLADRAG